MARRNTVRTYEDPSIAHVAKLEAVRIWTEIEDLSIAGQPFYHAREMALAANIRGIAKVYGSEVARRVEVAIMSRAPHTMDKRVINSFDDRMRIYGAKVWGRLRKRDRLCIWLFSSLWTHPPHKPGDPVIFI